MLIVGCFVVTFCLALLLGYAESRAAERDPTGEEAVPYSRAAIAVFIIQALLSLALFAGSILFPVSAFLLAFVILCHHTVIHRNSKFEGETCSCAPFQLKDISNHETWVVACIVAGAVSFSNV